MPGWASDLIRWLVFDRIGTMVFWGVMSCITALVAACGPSRLARVCAIYLMFGWAVSNLLHFEVGYLSRREGFSYLDAFGGCVMFIIWLSRPRAWLGLVIAATTTQLIMHIFAIGAPHAQRWTWDLVNNLLYGMQLLATCSPTFMKVRRGPWPLETRRWRPRSPSPKRGKLVLVDVPWPRKGVDY